MMKKWHLLAVLLLAALPVFALDPNLLKLAGPETRLLAGINFEQARSTPFGQFLMSRIQAEDPGFKKFVDSTGFDPRRDLRQVLIAAASGRRNGFVVVTGFFDRPRIAELVKSEGGSVTGYQGFEVMTSKNGGTGWFAFLDANTAVAGEADQVRGAIDRHKGAPGADARLTAKALEMAGKHDAWMVSYGSPAELAGQSRDPRVGGVLKGDVVQAILETSGGVKFGPTVEVTGQAVTRSEKDATALADVVRFLANLVQLNRDQRGAGEVASWLDSLQLETTASTVTLTLSIPEDQLEQLIESHHNRPRRARRSRGTI